MTTKVLTGTISSGYTLSASYSALTITDTGAVTGTGGGKGVYPQAGGLGGTGLALPLAAQVVNDGGVTGGIGGAGGANVSYGSYGGPAGAGGTGAYLKASTSFANTGMIAGGAGGVGGEGGSHGNSSGGIGGAGGVGIQFVVAGSLANSGSIIGGQGGDGGATASFGDNGGPGGKGGTGAVLASGMSLSNTGLIAGGEGGQGANAYDFGGGGGGGGVGVDLGAGATLTNSGMITGGQGGKGGVGTQYGAAYGAEGGVAAYLADGASLTNTGTIAGGLHGTALYPSAIPAGTGVKLAAKASLVNGGTTTNTALIKGGAGVYGGDYGATVTNFGTIDGSGKYSVQLNGGDNRVIAEAGSSFIGTVSVEGTLELAGGTGTIDGLDDGGVISGDVAMTFAYGFKTFVIDAGGSWTLKGSGTLASGGTLSNSGELVGALAMASTNTKLIVDAGSQITGAVSGAGGRLELASGTGTITGLGAGVTLSGGISMSFSGFGFYYADAGGKWTLQGNSLLAAGKYMTNAGTLVVSGALLDQGVLTNATGGAIEVGNASSIEAQKLANYGTIYLASTGSDTDLRVAAAGLTLGALESGYGSVVMSGPLARIVGASATSTLTNYNNTIGGAGFIGLGEMTLVNKAAGVIDASIKGELLVNTKGETLTNAGLMESTLAGAFLVLNATTIANAGGTIAGAGGVVDLQNSEVIGGTLAGTRPINVNTGSSTLDGADAGSIALDGTVQILSGTTLTVEGALNGTGAVDLYGSARLVVGAAGITLSGGGQVDTNSVAANSIVGATASATLTNYDHINAVGQLGDGSMILLNAGVIVDAQSVALTINTGAKTIGNAGIIESDGKGGVVIDSAVLNLGTLLAAAGTLSLDGLVTGAGVGKINGGTLYVEGAFAENVAFAGTTGVLKLGDSEAYRGTVTGLSFTGSNALDLADIHYVAGKTSATYTPNAQNTGGVLKVAYGATSASITLVGYYLQGSFSVSGDGHGGTKVVDPQAGPGSGPILAAASLMAQTMAGFGPDHSAPVVTTAPIGREDRGLLCVTRAGQP